tara:strand:+ start:172 stop:831 length:660 start_codon:yes stop_codon:yes gene_type:complete
MAYDNLEMLKFKEDGIFGLKKNKNYKIEASDNNSPITLVTLVGGNIAPKVEQIIRQSASFLGSNIYIFGSSENITETDAQRLRISPLNYQEPQLKQLLMKSIGVYVTDLPGQPNQVIQITGQNDGLRNQFQTAGMGVVCGYLNTGANNETHPANNLTGGGIEIQLGKGLDLNEPTVRDYLSDLITNNISTYLGSLREDQRIAALRPKGVVQGAIYDILS